MAAPSRRPDGRFQPGHKIGTGRPLGSKNKVPADLRSLVVDVAAKLGKDGKGRDGIEGYIRSLAVTRPEIFAGFLGKVLPTRPAEAEAAFTVGIEHLTVLSVPSNHFFLADAVETADPWLYSGAEIEALRQIRQGARERAEAEAREQALGAGGNVVPIHPKVAPA